MGGFNRRLTGEAEERRPGPGGEGGSKVGGHQVAIHSQGLAPPGNEDGRADRSSLKKNCVPGKKIHDRGDKCFCVTVRHSVRLDKLNPGGASSMI